VSATEKLLQASDARDVLQQQATYLDGGLVTGECSP
jgi:hypothetical protein